MSITVTTPAPLPVTETRQPSTSGAVSEETKEVSAPEESLSPKYAQYARKEKALRSKIEEIRAREEAVKAKEAEFESSYVPKATLAERFKKDALGLANEFGVSYDEIAAQALTQPDPAIQKLLQKIEQLEAKTNQNLSRQDDQQKRAYDQAVNQIRTDAKLLIDSDAAYETIQSTGNVEAVVELIKETYEKEGTLLSVEDAAKEVENYLLEEALRLAQLRKVQERMKPQAPVEEVKLPAAEKLPMKTLTNAQMATSKPMSRKERAILAFKGELK